MRKFLVVGWFVGLFILGFVGAALLMGCASGQQWSTESYYHSTLGEEDDDIIGHIPHYDPITGIDDHECADAKWLAQAAGYNVNDCEGR